MLKRALFLVLLVAAFVLVGCAEPSELPEAGATPENGLPPDAPGDAPPDEPAEGDVTPETDELPPDAPGDAPPDEPADEVPGGAAMPAPEAAAAPEDTVDTFYGWYLSYEGDPMTDEAFLDSDALTDGFRISLTSQERPAGADPFLCTDALPNTYEVGDAETMDGSAIVPVSTDASPEPINVLLIQEGDVWRIDDVDCGGADGSLNGEPTE